ncbi:MAG: sodium-dependent transporter [Desulfurococcales archaeon]|nr:sodium-dependent transporter [Desulfurococcales archaeon]
MSSTNSKTEGSAPGETFGYWASRIGFILAIIGAMVGTGNIWRFPRMAAWYGGGSFLIAWFIALLVLAIPLLIAEGVLGIKTGHGTILSFGEWLGPKYAWMGLWLLWVNTVIGFYYTVVAGWTLRFTVYSVQGAFSTYKPGLGQQLWNNFIHDPLQVLIYDFIIWIIVAAILVYGTKGIETACKIMIPTLAVILVILAIRAVTLPGAGKGIEYLWAPSASKLGDSNTWLQAFSQSLWSTGAGWGIYLTYVALFSKERGKGPKAENNLNAFLTGFGNNFFSTWAGLAVIPAVAALAPLIGKAAMDVYQSGNTGLTFIWLSEMFSKMTAGSLWGGLFYLGLFFAALSSDIAIMMVPILGTQELFGWTRKKAVTIWIIIGFLASIPSAVSINFLNNQDWVWGLGLLISALFTFYVVSKKWKEALDFTNSISDVKIGMIWSYLIRIVTPILVLVTIVWWIVQSISWYPKTWWSPTETYSVGTVLLQWFIVLAVLIALRPVIARKVEETLKRREEVS